MSAALAEKPCVQCGATDRNKRGDCKPCNRNRLAAWRSEGVEHLMTKVCEACGATERNKQGACIPCSKKSQAEWYRKNAPTVSQKLILKKYGLTAEKFREMWESQKGLCAICDDLLSPHFATDHDHVTGVVRGILCRPCNLALGLFKDDPSVLQRAGEYLIQAASPLRRVV
jgi:hypothetical protein